MAFIKATKSQSKGRIGLIGVSGSGKTWTALKVAAELAAGIGNGRVALIDTENGSAAKYADTYDFDHQILTSFTPRSYIAAIHEAEEAGYGALVVDSLSHGWVGKDGVLAMVDNATARGRSGNAFTSGWREVTPEHNALVDALVRCACHLIVTMRSKTEYVIDEANGKKIPRKIGMAPVQREGLEYEFDVVAEMDAENTLVVTKTRCSALSGAVMRRPGAELGQTLKAWLGDGVPAKAAAPAAAPAPDPLEDNEEFLRQFDGAIEDSGFDDEARAAMMKAMIAGYQVDSIYDLLIGQRYAVLKAIKNGKLDKYKTPAEPAAA